MHCINIGNRFPNVLRYGMVKFQCDTKKIVRKTEFFGFCVEMSSFFAKISACVMYFLSIICRLFNEENKFFGSW